MGLPRNSILSISKTVKIKITGLRNPCNQINAIQEGLMKAVLNKDEEGNLIRKSRVMGIVLEGCTIIIGNEITIELPSKPHLKLEPV